MKREFLTLMGSASLTVLLSGVAIAGSGQGAAKSGNPKAHGGSENPASSGAVTSELARLNAAHASPRALERAAAGSMPGKLAIYSAEYIAAQAAVDAALIDLGLAQTDHDAAHADVIALQAVLDGLSLGDFGSQADYEAAVALAQADVDAAQLLLDDTDIDLADANTALTQAEALDDAALATLTDGEGLSGDALAELLALLGL